MHISNDFMTDNVKKKCLFDKLVLACGEEVLNTIENMIKDLRCTT